MRRLLAVSVALLALAVPALASTPTTNYSLAKPSVNADADTWGTLLNSDLDSLDSIIFGKCDLAGATAAIGGCTFTGTPTFAAGTTSLAPFLLQSGSLLTSPAAGAVEWDGTSLYVTQTSGPTRQKLFYTSGGTFSGKVTFQAGASGGAGFSFGVGTAPSSPSDGDCWLTTTDVDCQVNGSTLTLASTGSAPVTSFNGRTGAITLGSSDVTTALGFTPTNKAGDTLTGKLTTVTGSTSTASLNLPNGVADPTSPARGDLWNNADALKFRINGSTKTLAFLDSTLSGNTTGSAATLTTGRTISTTGDVTCTTGAFNGSANVSCTAALANTAVTPGSYGDSLHVNQATYDSKGRATSASSVSIATMVGDSGSGGTKGLVPAPASGDAAAGKYLKADGTWSSAGTVPAQFYATISGTTATVHGTGVTSMTYSGSGAEWIVTLSSARPSTNFAAVCMATSVSGNQESAEESDHGDRTTSSFHVIFFDGAGQHQPSAVSCMVMGG